MSRPRPWWETHPKSLRVPMTGVPRARAGAVPSLPEPQIDPAKMLEYERTPKQAVIGGLNEEPDRESERRRKADEVLGSTGFGPGPCDRRRLASSAYFVFHAKVTRGTMRSAVTNATATEKDIARRTQRTPITYMSPISSMLPYAEPYPRWLGGNRGSRNAHRRGRGCGRGRGNCRESFVPVGTELLSEPREDEHRANDRRLAKSDPGRYQQTQGQSDNDPEVQSDARRGAPVVAHRMRRSSGYRGSCVLSSVSTRKRFSCARDAGYPASA